MRTVTVKSGDTLSAIAQRELGAASRYPEIARLNHLPNADLIYPGQVLQIPEEPKRSLLGKIKDILRQW